MDDISTLLVLAVLGSGYIFCSIFHLTRLRMLNIPWEQRLFESALIGSFFFVFSRFYYIFNYPEKLLNTELFFLFKRALPFHFSGTLALTLFCSLCFAFSLNLLIPFKRAFLISVKKYGNSMSRKISKLILNKTPALLIHDDIFTVGIIQSMDSPFGGFENPSLELSPLLQGFINREGDLVFTKKPYRLYDDTKLIDFFKIGRNKKNIDVNKYYEFSDDLETHWTGISTLTLHLSQITEVKSFDLKKYFDESSE